jgi:YVTN family beta-propeller protein
MARGYDAGTMNIRATLIAAALLFTVPAQARENGYRVARKVPVAGPGTYYDFLTFDPGSRRLYVSFGDQVAILDGDEGTVIGSLPGAKKVHGVVAAAGRVFVTDGGSDSVRVYDARSMKPAGEVKTGKNPDAILHDPASKRVFAFNHSAGTVTVIDPTSLAVKATIEVPGALEVGRADGKGTVWVNVEDRNEIARIDSTRNAVTARWPLAPCEAPTGLAFDPRTRRLFAGCESKHLAVVDADSGKVITTLPIGPGVDGVEFDAETRTIFASCGGDGTLAVIKQESANQYTLAGHVPTQERAKTLALDPKRHRVFLSAATFATPTATPANPKPRGALVPGTFQVLIVEPLSGP